MLAQIEFYPAPGIDPFWPIIERALEISHYEMMIFMPILILTVWHRRAQDQAKRSLHAPNTAKTFAARIAKFSGLW